jgi:ribosomal protein S3AE
LNDDGNRNKDEKTAQERKSLRVDEIKDGKAMTKFIGHDCTRDYLSRIVRPRTTRIDTNDIIDLVDNKLRVKTVAISNRSVSKNVESAIRKNISA